MGQITSIFEEIEEDDFLLQQDLSNEFFFEKILDNFTPKNNIYLDNKFGNVQTLVCKHNSIFTLFLKEAIF